MAEQSTGRRGRQPVEPLVDRFGRVHTHLRISVTDRCNLRCFYCMPAGLSQHADRHELLSFEEIERFVRVVAPMGVRWLRLTGGEPLLRRGLPELVGRLLAVPGVQDLGLTTNGLLLPEQAAALRAAGLRRINIHLDTLEPERFRQITRSDGLERVLEGIFLCKRLGFDPIKINVVAVRGCSEAELVRWGRFAREHDVEVRFIEFMPLDADRRWQPELVLTADRVRQTLQRAIMPLRPLKRTGSGAAESYVFEDGVGRIGLIASITEPFCGTCSRLRLTADGKIRNCLFAQEEFDVKSLMRSGGSDEQIAAFVRHAVSRKNEGHKIHSYDFQPPQRPMYAVGG